MKVVKDIVHPEKEVLIADFYDNSLNCSFLKVTSNVDCISSSMATLVLKSKYLLIQTQPIHNMLVENLSHLLDQKVLLLKSWPPCWFFNKSTKFIWNEKLRPSFTAQHNTQSFSICNKLPKRENLFIKNHSK